MLGRHCERSEAIQTVRRLPLDCRVASAKPKFILSACIAVEGLLAMPTVGCSQQAPIPPHSIISNNPCIDSILAEIAIPGQIGAVSAYSQDEASSSAPLAWARALPALGTSAEEIIAAQPRLFLTGNIASTGTNAALTKAGVKLVAVGVPASIAESEAQVIQIAQAIGRDAAGQALVNQIELAVSTPFPFQGGTQSAIIWQTGGFVAGKGTLQDELLSRAGYRNASATYGLKQWDVLPLETLVRNPPDVIFTPLSAKGDDARALTLRHGIMRHLKGKTRIVDFPDKLLFCGGPTIIRAMARLRPTASAAAQP
jgi:iron complex transport system substrate-binding protein